MALKMKLTFFFEESGFRCPERKGMADFLQEVINYIQLKQLQKEKQNILRMFNDELF